MRPGTASWPTSGWRSRATGSCQPPAPCCTWHPSGGTGRQPPAADVYAATAVFFECLAGRPPFAGKLPQLQEQHAVARVPLDQIEPPLQEIILRGLAKNPASRPSAIGFVSELESAASAAYGRYWEEHGRRDLADRAAAVLPLLASDRGAAPARSHRRSRSAGGRKRRVLGIAAIAAAAVLVIGGVATAVTLKQQDRGNDTASLSGSSPQLMAVKPSFTAVANVTPPVAAARCTTPTTFGYSGTLSATMPGTVRYQWVYSSGKPGPVRTVRFTRAGHQLVAGQTVAARTASGGWGEIKVISPVAKTSGKATYRLLCGGSSVGGVTVTAAVTPAARTARCVPAPPDFAAAGSIRAAKATAVTYYWAQSDGVNSAPATLTFHRPGTLAVKPLAIAPPGTSGTGEAVLVVTSPVTAASRPAGYTLTCKTPVTTPGSPTAPAKASSSPASSTPSPGSSSTLFMDIGTMRPSAVYGEPWTGIATVSGGKGPYTWSVTGLPPGLTATANYGTLTISGSPAALGVFSLGFSVKDSSSPALTATNSFDDFPVTDQAVAVSVNGPATATRGQSYSATVTATGGDGTFIWDTTSMVEGLTWTVNGGTLTISGTPQSLGEYTAGGTVSDDGSPPQVLHWSLPITTNAAPLAITGSAPSVAEVGQPYLATLTATGGNGSFGWTPVSLAPGLTGTANGATLTISGTPTTAGSYQVDVLVSSGTQPTAGRTFTLVIGP